MANIGYVRVSSQEQNTDRQFALFDANRIVLDRIYTEKMSGKEAKNRPQLQALLDYVREGDTVFVESISRLARNIKDLLEIVEQLQAKKVAFKSIKESNIDTTGAQGRFLLSIFGAMAELERETIRERQREGIDIALAEGRPYGRPSATISKTFGEHYKQWKAGEIKTIQFMKLENLKKTTFYKLVKIYENQK